MTPMNYDGPRVSKSIVRRGISEAPDIETSSADYASRFVGTGGAYLLGIQERLVVSLLGDRHSLAGKTILDVGGGHGQLAGPLARLGCVVTVAGSDESCAERIRSGPHADAIAFRATNLLTLPFEDRQFDTVVSVRLISHITDWRALIGEMCRVADKAVIIDYPTYRSLNLLSRLAFPIKRAIERNTRHYQTFRNSVIQAAFAEHGFHTAVIEKQFAIPMGFHRAFNGTPVVRLLEEGFRKLGITRRFGGPVLIKFERGL
jgi:2-polyprenyl-3-methyl-5-hydroxy-6-metoxy-1,4-benzoquinol methylase